MATPRDYLLIAKIAETDFGETYRGLAIDADGNRTPALFKLLAPRVCSPEVVSAVVERVRALAGLSHPSASVPYAFGLAGERYVLAAPYVSGHDLGTVLLRLRAREIALPLPRAVHIVAEAANGLAALHQAGVAHGSISPSEIFVTFEGSVRLAADGLRSAMEIDRETRHLALRGRKAYRAPEQSRGALADAPSDVYALGAVAYELITGRSTDAGGARGTSTRSDSLEAPSRVDRRIPMKFDPVILGALETARSRRYKDAAEVRDALWEYLDTMGQIVIPAEVAEFARSVMPNEVVEKDFDPDEIPAPGLPVSGPFSLAPPRIPQRAAARSYSFDAAGPAGAAAATPAGAAGASPGAALTGAPGAFPASSDPPPAAPGEIERAETVPGRPAFDPARSDTDPQGFPATATFDGAPPTYADLPAFDAGHTWTAEDGPMPLQAPPVAPQTPAPSARAGQPAGAATRGSEPARPPASRPLDADETLLASALPDPEPQAPGERTDPFDSGVIPATAGPAEETYDGADATGGPFRPLPVRVALGGVALAALVLGFSLGRLTAPEAPAELTGLGQVAAGAPSPTAEALPVAAQPAEPAPVAAAPAPSAAPEPEAEPGPEVQPRPDPEPPRKTVRPRTRRPRTGTRRAAARTPKPAAETEQGRVTVWADHRARVFIDGKDTGHYTPLKGYRLPAGRHEVKLVAKGSHATADEAVVIRSGETTTLKVRLR